ALLEAIGCAMLGGDEHFVAYRAEYPDGHIEYTAKVLRPTSCPEEAEDMVRQLLTGGVIDGPISPNPRTISWFVTRGDFAPHSRGSMSVRRLVRVTVSSTILVETAETDYQIRRRFGGDSHGTTVSVETVKYA
ncbi:MAG: hypothetical protein ABIJ46_05150, partial [bacterium]